MNDFIFDTPTNVIFGKDRLKELPQRILDIDKRVLLLYGKNSIKRTGLYDQIVKQLNDLNIFFVEQSGIDPNPRIESVVEGAKLCKENNLGMILAVGGGSVIDCAKGIAMAVFYKGNPWDFYEGKASPTKALPIGTVLTLAATGSEMNGNTVISNLESEEKLGYGNKILYPRFSFLDPENTFTVPPRQTAAGSVDIIAHCFEFYFSRIDSAYLQNRLAESIIKTVIHYAPIALKEPDNYEARANLMWASSMALNGVISEGTTFDGFNHSLEHTISAIYDITHGVGLGILMPHWLEEILDSNTEKKLAQYARNVWDVSLESDREAALEGIERTKAFITSLGLPIKLSKEGIPSDRFSDMADMALKGTDGKLGTLNPLDKKGIINVLKRAE